jgi:choline dehydrogenase-like flavoprotein
MADIKEYDVIVVGSGAGGAAVAREAALRGRRVLLLERGGRWGWLGNTLAVAMSLERFGMVRSREGYSVTFGDTYGGLSVLAAGCAVPPPPSVFGPCGIDLSREAAAAAREMKVQVLPDELIGRANLRLLDAAVDAGYGWRRMENFIDPEKCVPDCGDCMLGCRRGAKFTARQFGDDAAAAGAEVLLHTTVRDVIVEGGRAAGVRGSRLGMPVTYRGKAVVLSGGVSNVHILRRAGIARAGRGFCCDWLQFVGGIVPGISTARANPMTVGTLEHYESDGIALLPVFPNWSMFAVVAFFTGLRHLLKLPRFWSYSGIMVKVRDEAAGELYRGTSFSKPVTESDRKRLDKGVGIIKSILKKAGAGDASIVALKPSGAHPSATCRIGDVVDANLETEIGGLYCCDASVFPSSLGLPVVWTAVSLGMRLAAHLERTLR